MAFVEGTEMSLRILKCPVGVCVKKRLFCFCFSTFLSVVLVEGTETCTVSNETCTVSNGCYILFRRYIL